MTLAQRITRARELRRKGWTLHKIGKKLGVDPERVRSWMYPRPWPRQTSSRVPVVPVSREEAQVQALSRRRARSRKIQRLWAQNLTLEQMAAQIEGLGVAGVRKEVLRLRRAGWDVPKRKSGPRRAAA